MDDLHVRRARAHLLQGLVRSLLLRLQPCNPLEDLLLEHAQALRLLAQRIHLRCSRLELGHALGVVGRHLMVARHLFLELVPELLHLANKGIHLLECAVRRLLLLAQLEL